MTAALAIAATTEVLHYLVESALTKAAAVHGFAAPGVRSGAPPKPETNGSEPSVVNLFLHGVTPNPALRNHEAPYRDANGRRRSNAPLALDLHYLLSAHGGEAIREIGLGAAMHSLQQAAIVPRTTIRSALESLASSNDPAKKALATRSGLAEQLESLTISLQSLDVDALTKLWTAVQSPLRPSAGYLVTTVLLDDDQPQATALPALQAALTALPLRRLVLQRVEGRRGTIPWPIVADADLLLEGEGFDAPELEATLGGQPLTVDATASGPSRLRLRIPAATVTQLRVGQLPLALTLHGVVNGQRRPVQQAVATVLLRPSPVVPAGAAVPSDPQDATRVTGPLDVGVSPPVDRAQRAALHLAPLGGDADVVVPWIPPAPAANAPAAFATLRFQLKRVPKGTYLVRLQVAGIDSQPMPDAAGVFQPQLVLA